MDDVARVGEVHCTSSRVDLPPRKEGPGLSGERARSLFLEKRLEEAHSSFLTGRIDELRRTLRLGTVEEQPKFLPHGMVVHLQRIMQDARVDAWERGHFLEALERQDDLTPAQRGKARRVIDGWFARDAEVKG